jgi:serine/threonine protein kinase
MSEPTPLEAIFFAALEKPATERGSYLAEACGGDTDLRRRVERMLTAQLDAASFLETPHSAIVREASPTIDPSPLEKPGTQIGPYKLLQQIGEGGMGVVYMAEQTEPVQRKVALKLIKPGMDSRQVIARLEAERQALAMMDHVNIARVIDAGSTESGRPYFVMELVHGVPITKYCDDNRLTPRQRLELYVPVCQAIQHAHQKGIIHRDIKPSNVMVTLYDGKPVPKVIDFGVAKATEQKLTERTLFTQYGTMVGTLEYMSPEQAEMSALGVDTRSDIYSLGVLLYELLTGSTPLSSRQMKEAAYDEILRLIKEEEPPKPSTRLSESGEALASISANRHTEPAKLTRLMRGELDWIVMKTLEKDRNRRYETAKDFAADVQRYLNNEAVQACPPSSWYRLRKFVRRNKGPVLAALLILLVLVAGVIGTTWSLIREQQHSQELQAAHERERLLNERARQAIESVTSDTAIEQLTRQKELSAEQKDFLDKMIQYYAESAQEVTATEQERSRQARAYFQMGRLNQVLGRSKDSENAYPRAVALLKQLAADFPTRPEFRQQLALTYNAQGTLLRATGRPTEAEAVYGEALPILKQLAADFPTRPEFRQILAGIHNNLGGMFHESGRLKEAEAAQDEALAIRKQLAADFPDRLILRRALAMSHNNLGWLFQDTKRLEKAEASYRDAVALQKQAVADFPDRPELRLELAKYRFILGNLLRGSGRLKEAEAVYGEALPILKQLAADFPNRPEFRQELAGGHYNVGLLLRDKGLLKDAEAAFGDAVTLQKRVVADFPNSPEFRRDLAMYQFDLGNLLRDRGQLKEAELVYGEALPIRKQLAADFPKRPEFRQALADGYNNVGILLRDKGLLKDAEGAQAEALAIQKQLATDFPEVPDYRNAVAGTLLNLANVANMRRDFVAARKLVDEAIPYHQAALKANPLHTDYRAYYRNSLVELTQSYAGLGDRAAAVATATKRRDLGWNGALDAYEAACMMALCVPIVEKDDKLDEAQRRAEKEFYAGQAIVMLRESVARGFRDAAYMKQDKYISAIHEHEDFKKVVAELEAKLKN